MMQKVSTWIKTVSNNSFYTHFDRNNENILEKKESLKSIYSQICLNGTCNLYEAANLYYSFPTFAKSVEDDFESI